jgi:hypothetical protein
MYVRVMKRNNWGGAEYCREQRNIFQSTVQALNWNLSVSIFQSSHRRRFWAEDFDDEPPAPPPPRPRSPVTSSRASEPLPAIARDRGMKSRMSDVTTSSQYGCFYAKEKTADVGPYRLTSGTKFPPIGWYATQRPHTLLHFHWCTLIVYIILINN